MRAVAAFPFALLLVSIHVVAQSPEYDEARGKVQEAEAELGAYWNAGGGGPSNPVYARYQDGRRLLGEARDLFLAGGIDRSGDAGLHAEYGALLEQLEHYDLAADAFAQACRLAPEDALYWLAYGVNLARLGGYRAREARMALDRCVALNPEAATVAAARSALGDLYRALGLFVESRDYYDAVLADTPTHRGARKGLAELEIREGNVLAGSNLIDALQTRDSAEAAELETVVRAGLDGFQRNRGWFPDEAPDHLAYARLLIRVGRTRECVSALERSLELKNDDYRSWNFLGSISMQLGDRIRAEEAFRESLSLKADQPRTQEAIQALTVPPPEPPPPQ